MPSLLRRLTSRRGLDNSSFWDERYLTNPELGSGIGSRGDVAVQKRELVESVYENSGRGSVLDVSRFDTYTGVDVSQVAVERARERYPQHTFIRADFAGRAEPDVPPADFTLCFDVLIHQFDAKAYRRMVERIVERTRRTGLVSANDRPPRRGSPIVAYHEPISMTLARAGATDIAHVTGYHGVAVFRFGPKR